MKKIQMILGGMLALLLILTAWVVVSAFSYGTSTWKPW